MDALRIKGGRRLDGTITAGGSKNAALPVLAATLLSPGVSRIEGVPDLQDVRTMLRLLEALGAPAEFRAGTVSVDARRLTGQTAPYDLVRRMRASICCLGPLLARCGRARISLPGGCVIGNRPVDMHLRGLARLGARLSLEDGYITGTAERLAGAPVFLGGPFGSSVLATANVLMAACLAPGETQIEFAACEPEVVDLAHCLVGMGARIDGIGSHLLRVRGVGELRPAAHRIIPDRIEAGTLLLAGAVTGGTVRVNGCRPDHLFAVLDKLEEAGLDLERQPEAVTVGPGTGRRGVDVVTMPYPGFPTDLQAQFMTLLCLAEGTSLLTEKVFPERFMHAAELKRMGADIVISDGTAVVRARGRLIGTPVMASDLRASAALVLAGLAAHGETVVSRIYHLDRGYQRLEEKLGRLGAQIERFAQ